MARDLIGRFAPVSLPEFPNGLVERDPEPDDRRTCTRCENELNEFDKCEVCYWCVASDQDNGDAPYFDEDLWDDDEPNNE